MCEGMVTSCLVNGCEEEEEEEEDMVGGEPKECMDGSRWYEWDQVSASVGCLSHAALPRGRALSVPSKRKLVLLTSPRISHAPTHKAKPCHARAHAPPWQVFLSVLRRIR